MCNIFVTTPLSNTLAKFTSKSQIQAFMYLSVLLKGTELIINQLAPKNIYRPPLEFHLPC